MKPIWLTMSAFGSYAGQETIDFSGIGQGVFLVAGDTGSGKTTIFDGIVYALYDRTSGGVRDGNMMRSHYASLGTHTFVEFCFQCKGENYRIIRNPDYERESLRKDKNGHPKKTQEKSKAELFLPDGSLFRGNKKEVNKKIEEILGMDARQFMQMAMIAQGDFLKLLHAKSEERKEIFSRLFDTGVYGTIQEELKKQEKETFIQLKEKENACREQMGGILYPSGWEKEEEFRSMKEAADLDGILTLLSFLAEEGEKEEKKTAEEHRKVQERIMGHIQRKELAQDILEINERLFSQEEWLNASVEIEERMGNEERNAAKSLEEADSEWKSYEIFCEESRKEIEGQIEACMQKKEELELLAGLFKKYKECLALREKKARSWEVSASAYQEARMQYELVYEDFFREQAGILAKNLQRGYPCPVCGSKEHPNPARAADHAPGQEEVKAAKARAEKLEKDREKAGTELQGAVQEVSASLAALSQEGKRAVGKEFDGSQLQWEELTERRLSAAKEEAEKKKKNLEKQDREQKAKKKLLIQKKEDAEKALLEARTAREAFIRQSERVRGENLAAKEQAQKLRDQWLEKGLGEPITEEAEKMAAEWGKEVEILKEMEKALEKKHKDCYSHLHSNQRIYSLLLQYREDYKRLKENYEIIHNLSQTANGTLAGSIKIDFESYIQRRYFQKVVQSANIRLMQMASGQFLLKCKDLGQLSGRGKAGLDLDVYSLVTDSVRDVKTLSGGESFLAALALALGMADVVSASTGGLRLETMFIDEGFGSLDAHARELAVRVLYELSGQDRIIGIISHVTELKEQIEKKLYIKKGKNGSHVQWVT